MLDSDWADIPQQDEDWADIPEQTDKYGKLEALGLGAAQGVSLGFAPRVAAAAESLYKGEPYEQSLKDWQSYFEGAEKEHPYISMAGNVAGSVPTIALPGVLGVKGAIKGAALLGGLTGAAASSDLTNIPETAMRAGAGTVLGGGLAGGASLLGKGISKLTPESLKQAAYRSAGKAITKVDEDVVGAAKYTPEYKAAEAADELGKLDPIKFEELGQRELGRFASEKGIISGMESKRDILKKAADYTFEKGKEIGNTVKKLDEAVSKSDNPFIYGINKKELIDATQAALNNLDRPENIFSLGTKRVAVIESMQSQLQALQSNPSEIIPFRTVQSMITRLGDEVKDWGVQSGPKELRDMIKELFDAKAAKISKVDYDNLMAQKADFHRGSLIIDSLVPEVRRKLNAKLINIWEGTGGAMIGGLATGRGDVAGLAAFVGGTKVISTAAEKGRQAMMYGQLKTARAIEKIQNIIKLPNLPQDLKVKLSSALSRGPKAAIATDFILQQTHPEYNKYVNEGGNK